MTDKKKAETAEPTPTTAEATKNVAPLNPAPVEPKPSIGRIIHVCVAKDRWRPAVVTQAFTGRANCLILLDPGNDSSLKMEPPLYQSLPGVPGVLAHGMSLEQGDGVGNWRWPAKV